jgi:hypothetical protein
MIAVEILKLLIFSFLLNWCISLQIFQQSLDGSRRKEKIVAVVLGIIAGAIAGGLLVW